MSYRRTIVVLCALAAFAAGDMLAQPLTIVPAQNGFAIGVYGGIARGTLDADFNVNRGGLSDVAHCGRYRSGTVNGFVGGLSVELPVTTVFGVVGSAEFSRR